MNRITEYRTVFIRDVQKHIEDGWQPYGSPYYAAPNKYQAMVKYEQERNYKLDTHVHTSTPKLDSKEKGSKK